eukprot:jgi/Botrbrau1/4560/Bobra.60_2s0047.1
MFFVLILAFGFGTTPTCHWFMVSFHNESFVQEPCTAKLMFVIQTPLLGYLEM